jgi:hypothetical protein
MSNRFFVPACALALMLALSVSGQTPGQPSNQPAKPAAAKSKAWTPPRTPDGHPDLQGVWTNATITRMERLPEFNGKLNLTEEEAAKFEKADHEAAEEKPGVESVNLGGQVFSGTNAGYNVLFIDRGSELARVDGVKRSSLIVDPPDGRVPTLARGGGRGAGGGAGAGGGRGAAAGARGGGGEAGGRGGFGGSQYDSVKNRPASERCLIGFGSTSGPPMMPVLYNNNYEIVQTPDAVMILVEMVHDVRVVRMNATHAPPEVRSWLGDSIGHWEGDTLVVDTTNFNGKTRFRGSSENLHVIERFSRPDANNILYRVTLEDPSVFSKPWTMEYPFAATPGPVYEYACHEGNYAMTDILGGARKSEAEAAAKK